MGILFKTIQTQLLVDCISQQMKGKKKVQFFVKQVSAEQKEVNLNGKYSIKSQHPLFETIEFLMPLIDEKNSSEMEKYHDVFEIRYFPTLEFTLAGSKMEEEKCMICLEEFVIGNIEQELAKHRDEDILMLGCSHKYHRHCLIQLIGEKHWAKCPICSTIFGRMTGDQPQGKMTVTIDKNTVCQGYYKGTIIINYSFPNGRRNGKAYTGTSRTAYLPNTPEGQEVLELLREAFNRKLTFTVGRSVTTGLDNQVVWNGIHHKTNINGGASHFGYPDATYLTRVKEQLACKGIVLQK